MRAVTDASCELLGEFFATFAHTTRMRILCALQRGPRSVTEIALSARISIPNASQHLRLMRDRGAVISDKHAQSVYYEIADPRIIEAMAMIRISLSDHLQRNAKRASARPASRGGRNHLQPA